MKTKNILLVSLLATALTASVTVYMHSRDAQTRILDSYVNIIASELSEEDKYELASMSEDELISLYFSLGMDIRNRWLWNNRQTILSLYLYCHGTFEPETMSGLFVQRLWEKVYEDMPPEKQKEVDKRRNKALRYKLMRQELDKYLGPAEKIDTEQTPDHE